MEIENQPRLKNFNLHVNLTPPAKRINISFKNWTPLLFNRNLCFNLICSLLYLKKSSLKRESTFIFLASLDSDSDLLWFFCTIIKKQMSCHNLLQEQKKRKKIHKVQNFFLVLLNKCSPFGILILDKFHPFSYYLRCVHTLPGSF